MTLFTRSTVSRIVIHNTENRTRRKQEKEAIHVIEWRAGRSVAEMTGNRMGGAERQRLEGWEENRREGYHVNAAL